MHHGGVESLKESEGGEGVIPEGTEGRMMEDRSGRDRRNVSASNVDSCIQADGKWSRRPSPGHEQARPLEARSP